MNRPTLPTFRPPKPQLNQWTVGFNGLRTLRGGTGPNLSFKFF